MPTAVGVAFKRVAKSYWFDPADLHLNDFDRVIVETARGNEIGTVRVTAREIPEDELQSALKRVVRMADERDYEQERRNRDRAREAGRMCADRIKGHNLPMRLLQAEYCFDGSQITFYFSAEARVDFRDLVKDLAAQLRCNGQLHQG